MGLEFMMAFVSMGNINLISLCHETISREYVCKLLSYVKLDLKELKEK